VAGNSAVEHPPNVAPASNFSTTTYYPNVWDQSPSHYQSNLEPLQVATLPHFTILSSANIPEQLLQEKHYTNVLEKCSKEETPSSDREKIKPMFS
jgi:glycogenin glucosyltransferase